MNRVLRQFKAESTDAADRSAPRHARYRQALPGSAGAGCLIARGRGRGDHGARRPERRRKIDADQGADRRLSPRQRVYRVWRRARRLCLASARPARRHQHHLSGNQPRSLPLGGRERLSRPRAPPLRPARLGPNERGSRGCAAALRGRNRRATAADGILNRDPADGGHRPRRLVQGAARHHGRADLLAR